MQTYCVDPLNGVFKEVPDGARVIDLSQGFQCVVDADVYEWASKFKWCCIVTRRGDRLYAYAARRTQNNGKMTHHRIHRLVAMAADDQHVDHKDGNTLDNRRVNVRSCTRAQNNTNRHTSCGSSKYIGVRRTKYGKWEAQIVRNRKTIYLGVFLLEVDAAAAYSAAASEAYGEFAARSGANPLA